MRKAEVACLTPTGRVDTFSRLVPALPPFEEALAAFTRTVMVQTDRGLVTVEDLWPGDRVRTVDHGFQTLLWRSMTMIVPGASGQDPAMGRLLRFAADSLGLARPMPDLVLGPAARLVQRGAAVRRITGGDAALIPARDYLDGIGIVEITPQAPVPAFHLGFHRHERIVANGVEVESYHPGPAPALGLRGDMLALFLTLFPHRETLEDFGLPALPRLRRSDLDLFDVA
jgi:hypothetical protein